MDDVIVFKLPEIKFDSITKRITLSTLVKVGDPLGLVTPCTLELKVFLQSCWKVKID